MGEPPGVTSFIGTSRDHTSQYPTPTRTHLGFPGCEAGGGKSQDQEVETRPVNLK